MCTSINTEARIGRLQISYGAANNLLTGTESVIVIFLGAKAVIANEMSIGMLYAFMAYRTNFSDAIISVVNQLLQYWMLGLHLERVSDITKSALEPGLEIESTLVLPVSGEFEAKNLSYRYSPTDPLIFSNFSLRIPQGSFVALYGPSGVGKTTLLKVLMGLLEPESGQLEIDGIPLVGLGTRSYRKNIAAVMQSDSLFSGSVRENIVFFDASPDLAKIKEACEQAEIHADIVSSPMGYDSLIGDMGSSLSGGQQQRLCIARAVATEPEVLLMDEPCSALDPIATAQVEELIDDLRKRYCVVIVTHSMQQAARVSQKTAFFHLGNLVEYGDTTTIFTKPEDPRTESYITGRIG